MGEAYSTSGETRNVYTIFVDKREGISKEGDMASDGTGSEKPATAVDTAMKFLVFHKRREFQGPAVERLFAFQGRIRSFI